MSTTLTLLFVATLLLPHELLEGQAPAAAEAVASGDYAKALSELRLAFQACSYPTSGVMGAREFRPLREHFESREQLRALLEEHASEVRITIVDWDEPGSPLEFGLTLRDRQSGARLSGAKVLIAQVDAAGRYMRDLDADWNPRLFGWARTGADGTISVRTIRPAHYTPEYESDEPAHVHFTVWAEGYRPWGGEIFFAGDPKLTIDARAEARRSGLPILRLKKGEDGVERGKATLRLQRE